MADVRQTHVGISDLHSELPEKEVPYRLLACTFLNSVSEVSVKTVER
jgi:hypothetical protein